MDKAKYEDSLERMAEPGRRDSAYRPLLQEEV